jgi:hypothetical protein
LSALAFLPVDTIPGAFNELKPCLLEEASKVTDWFENNFVYKQGKICNGLAV